MTAYTGQLARDEPDAYETTGTDDATAISTGVVAHGANGGVVARRPDSPTPEEGPPARTPQGSRSRFRAWRKRWGRRILGDGLLGYITLSILFVAFFNSGTNGMQTGRMVLLCIGADQVTPEGAIPEVNRDLVRFIGIFTLSVICALQYFSPEMGRRVNKAFAVVKLITLLVLIGVGGNAALKRGDAADRRAEWWLWYPQDNSLSFAKAMLAVLFSFEGWENATFVSFPPESVGISETRTRLTCSAQVAGEIPRGRHHVLQRGFIAAVFTVGIMYLLVVSVVVRPIPSPGLCLPADLPYPSSMP